LTKVSHGKAVNPAVISGLYTKYQLSSFYNYQLSSLPGRTISGNLVTSITSTPTNSINYLVETGQVQPLGKFQFKPKSSFPVSSFILPKNVLPYTIKNWRLRAGVYQVPTLADVEATLDINQWTGRN
jgi:hypothetical protein